MSSGAMPVVAPDVQKLPLLSPALSSKCCSETAPEEAWSKLAPLRNLEASQPNYGLSFLELCLKSKLFSLFIGKPQEMDELERVNAGCSLHYTCRRI